MGLYMQASQASNHTRIHSYTYTSLACYVFLMASIKAHCSNQGLLNLHEVMKIAD